MGYSLPVDKIVTRAELMSMVYTIPEQPDVIPYVTSYYKQRSGFCMTENQRLSLKDEKYHVKIDSSLTEGSLTYGELLIPGREKKKYFSLLMSVILQWQTMSYQDQQLWLLWQKNFSK